MCKFYIHFLHNFLASPPELKKFTDIINMQSQLPPGFHFRPSDRELITEYLRKKVLGEQLPSGVVTEGEVYGDDMQLPEIGELFIFVKRKKNQSGTKTIRSARNGHWKVTGNKKKIVDASGKHIGTRRSLVFKEKYTSGRRKNLLMDEYSLDRSMNQGNLEEWALCRIKQSNRSPERIRSQGDHIHDSMSIDMEDIWEEIDDDTIEQFPAETSGLPCQLVLDPPYNQSWMAMNTPASTRTAAPALVGSDDIINENFDNESFFRECLDLLYEDQA